MPKPKIEYIGESDANEMPKKSQSPKKGGWFIVGFLIFAFIMGVAGGIGGVLLLSENSYLKEKLGLKDIAINTTKTEKLKLEESSAITDTVKKVAPAVVSISTTTNVTNIFGRSYESEGGGTGFIITNDGLIVTNKHVVSDENTTYTVFTNDGKDYQAKILATDPFNDFAVLKIDAKGLPVVDLGDSDDLMVGQWVVAIGNALGEFDNSVTVGVISAKDRQITASGGGKAEKLEGLLQTDAAVNPGNSGGPLVNLKGQVIGINTAVANAENIGFAIPINVVKSAIDSIKKTGEIKRPMLGIRYLPITKEIAKINNLKVDYGALVIRGKGQGEVAVIPGSPAAKAGIEENDIILKINDEEISENKSLARILQQYKVGDEISLTILRDDKEKTVKATLTELE